MRPKRNEPVKTVVLATDFKDQAQGALGAAAILAAAANAELVACHVLPAGTHDTTVASARAELAKVLKSIPMARFPMASEALLGDPGDEILKLAKARKAQVLVVGSRQIDQDPLTLGTLAERLLRFAPMDTLMVRSSGWPRGRFASLVDLSDDAGLAVRRCAEMCRLGRLRDFDAVLVVNRDDPLLDVTGRHDAEPRLKAWLKDTDTQGVTAKPVVIEGGTRELARWALSNGVDLVFAGARGLGQGATDPLGSFVLKAARRLPSTIWLVRTR